MLDFFPRLHCLKKMSFLRPSNSTRSAEAAFEVEVNRASIPSKYDPGEFVPESSISALVTPLKIRPLVPNASPNLIEFICNKASKVFLTLWLGFPELRSELIDILTRFEKCGFDNNHLPIDDITREERCTEHGIEPPRTKDKCQHSDALNVFHEEPWQLNNLKRFRLQQWMFSAPVFKEESFFKTNLVTGCILPFSSKGARERRGYFGTVYEVGLRMDHQDVISEVRP
jgi:hypothetical protein